MCLRLPLVAVLVLAGLPGIAGAEPPDNDHWLVPTVVSSFPFEIEVDLTQAHRELDAFSWDCMPDDESPWTPVSPRYGDVWFSVTVPSLTLMIATAELPGRAPILGLYQGADPEPDRDWCDSDLEPGDPASIGLRLEPDVTHLIQLGACLNCGTPPVVRFALLEPGEADLGVHSLTVTRPFTPGPAGDLPQPTARDVAFRMSNPSARAARGIWHLKACHDHGTAAEYCVRIAGGLAHLEPGQEIPFTARWDATGSAGDFTICATVSPFDYIEADWTNNRRNADTWVLISNVQGENWPEYLVLGGFSSCYHHYWFY